jgi:DHA1 family bicyclomycin/chloramphenicol resistance-like MFS transporter
MSKWAQSKTRIRPSFPVVGSRVVPYTSVAGPAIHSPFVAANVLPIMIYTIGSSLIMPSVTLLLLDLFPTMRGMTSSLQGFIQFAFGGVVAGTIAPLLARSLMTLAAGMAGFSIASFLVWLAYQRRARATLKGWSP